MNENNSKVIFETRIQSISVFAEVNAKHFSQTP